jgi:ribosomal protein S6
MGEVVEVIPILGKPTAYVIKGSARGVYYVVTSVGHVTGKSIRSVGRVGKEASDLVVFTISSASGATEKTLDEAGKVVKKVARSLANNKKTRRNKTKKNKTRKS